MESLKQSFRPEFINRIDDIVIFNKLSKDSIKEIALLTLKEIEKRLQDRNITFMLTDKAIEWITDNGFDEIYGARPLKRLLKKELENKMAYALLEGEICDNQVVEIDIKNNAIILQKKI